MTSHLVEKHFKCCIQQKSGKREMYVKAQDGTDLTIDSSMHQRYDRNYANICDK
jgi:hypothetical protein